jgi:hypothetical protein
MYALDGRKGALLFGKYAVQNWHICVVPGTSHRSGLGEVCAPLYGSPRGHYAGSGSNDMSVQSVSWV